MTPQDIREKTFEKAMFGGYDMAAVQNYQEEVATELANAQKEIAVLKGKMKVLVDKVEEYRSTEEAMRKALMAAQRMAEDLVKEAEQKKALLPAVEVEPQLEEKVDFDTFCKSDLRAVKVKSCERVKKSDKLLRFTLDDGSGTDRQILSGIAKFYEPEALVGKTLAAIINLPPRKMMGQESCGMLLSAVHKEKGEEKLNLLMLNDAIPAGAKLC